MKFIAVTFQQFFSGPKNNHAYGPWGQGGRIQELPYHYNKRTTSGTQMEICTIIGCTVVIRPCLLLFE